MLRRALFLIALAIGSWSHAGSAESKNPAPPLNSDKVVITGQVAYSDPNAKGRNSQLEAQDALVAWSGQLEAAVKKGGEGKIEDLSPDTASYLSVLYFYCTVKEGPCPFVLETILDSEVIGTKTGKEAPCVSMKRFFKAYLANGLDDRGKFMYPLTRGLEMNSFNSDVRPRFLECKETVSAMVEDKELLAQRFGEKGAALESIVKFTTLLKQVKDDKVDIYVATGLSKEE